MSSHLRDVGYLLRRNLREARRSPVIAFVFPIVFPVVAQTLVAAAYGRMASLPGFPVRPYAAYMAPGMFLLAAMMGAGYSATALVLDVQTGFTNRLRLLNVRPSSMLLARLAFDALRVLPAAFIVLVVSILLGAKASGGVPGIVGLLVLCSLWSVTYGGLFYVVAVLSWNPQAPLAMSPLFILLMFTSPAAIPIALLPGWLAQVARANPFTYVVEAARELLAGTVTAPTLLSCALVLVLGLALTQSAVVPLFRAAVES